MNKNENSTIKADGNFGFKPLSRRDFLKITSMGAGAAVILSILPKAQAQNQALTSAISNNHGHQFVGSLEQVKAAGPRVYDLKGQAPHNHQVNLDSQAFTQLFTKGTVDLQSTQTLFHSHVIRLVIA